MITARARAYVRRRATQHMLYTVRVERVTPPSFDEVSLHATAGSRTTVYEGVGRVWEITGSTTINIGEADLDIQSTQLSLPWNAPLLKKNDEVLVTVAPTDAAMVGKRYQIQSSAKAGDLRATRRYAISAVL